MAARTIVIGDIHGCAEALRALLAAIRPGPDDRIVALGDYIDRGEQSREVVEQLLGLERHCQLIPLLGNHELMLMRAFEDYSQAYFWLECGGQQTLDSYGGTPADIPQSHHDFFQRCVPYYELDNDFFVHANYDAQLELSEQPEELLFWAHLSYFMPAPHRSGKRAFVGHTPQRTGEILDLKHLVCVDTFCVGDRWLTALDIDAGTVWQASKRGVLRNVEANSA